ncbi:MULTISPECIES: radical SAM protein [Clostridioides]|uniref:radical SAM protein n=1 Tax=Clostridioides sp. ZZV14-6387 TaxID=2811497 RepID=UPI0007BB7C67|nr:radical SAM protein [Clostridioides sp. ZZV14-6387]CZR96103.1 Biotin synthase [Clostridioides difficile]CZS06943.1 Biotin synthase [Clostridioides difficile]
MIRLSSGTAIELGILNKKSDIPPTTAYIMIGEKCINKCSFCSQSIESSTRKDKLSRVVWPEFSKEEILDALRIYKKKNIKRICIQSMASEEAHKSVLDFINYINEKIDMPISLSAKLESDEEINKFFSAGVDKIGIAIDAANKELYEKIKGNNYDEKLKFITEMSKSYPNKISTHIIVGMGESHEDIYNLYNYLKENNITISLFAFTPVRGTKMEKISQPNIESYRRVQLMSYMINKGYSKECFEFKNGYLDNIKLDNDIIKDINKGYPFEIRGCKDCNRPYYNERPGSTIYNYSRPLNQSEIDLAIKEINL